MRIPIIRGIIDRRILANYRLDPEIARTLVPPPFRPVVVNGYAIGGICLIRLKQIRPRFFPLRWGLGSENAAHRIAVEWDVDGSVGNGVYVPRRDTSSRLSVLLAGKFFPGGQHHATFTVDESHKDFAIAMRSDDGRSALRFAGTVSDKLSDSLAFPSLNSASDFFERGSLGYSATDKSGRYEGIELCCKGWRVEPLKLQTIESSYFDDEALFPPGTAEFDCAILMRKIEHEWRVALPLR